MRPHEREGRGREDPGCGGPEERYQGRPVRNKSDKLTTQKVPGQFQAD